MISWFWVILSVPAIVILMVMLRIYGVTGEESPASAIIGIMSLTMAFVGLVLAYKSLQIAQDVQKADKMREEERTRVMREDEIPYVVSLLEILYMNMLKTRGEVERHMTDGKIKSKDVCEDLHKRARSHIAAIGQIESKFVETKASKYFAHLGNVIERLEELGLATPNTEMRVERFDDIIEAVWYIMTDMERNNRKVQDQDT